MQKVSEEEHSKGRLEFTLSVFIGIIIFYYFRANPKMPICIKYIFLNKLARYMFKRKDNSQKCIKNSKPNKSFKAFMT